MKIALQLKNAYALINLLHAQKCSLELFDTSLQGNYFFEPLAGEPHVARTQQAFIFSVLEVDDDYHVAAVWLPECEVLASDFAVIHIQDRKRITRAESLSPDAIFHPVNTDDPEEAYAVLSVGYSIHNGKPSARWFTEAASCDVHHRRLREGDNKQFALID